MVVADELFDINKCAAKFDIDLVVGRGDNASALLENEVLEAIGQNLYSRLFGITGEKGLAIGFIFFGLLRFPGNERLLEKRLDFGLLDFSGPALQDVGESRSDDLGIRIVILGFDLDGHTHSKGVTDFLAVDLGLGRQA